jgi:serine/threonine protein kinase
MVEHLLKSKYRIGEKISENPFSLTYKGATLSENKAVIIKIYKRGTLNAALIKRMRQKVKSLQEIEHPSIAKILDGDYGWQGYYYVREYVVGKSLKDLVRIRKKFDPQETRKIMLDICPPMILAHSNKIIHGALNLSNVIIRNDNSLVLTDFVISGRVKDTLPQKASYILESGEQLSPEEILGQAAEKSSDIFSLGLILYALLTMKDNKGAPFNLRKLRGGLIKDLDQNSHPKYMIDILKQCMTVDPLLRFKNFEDVEKSFKNRTVILDTPVPKITFLEVQDYPDEEKEPEKLEKKERKRTVFLAILIVVCLLAGILYAFLQSLLGL